MGAAVAGLETLGWPRLKLLGFVHWAVLWGRAYAAPMSLIFESFWRAAAYCLLPRVLLLSLLPVVLIAALALGLGYFYWEPALDLVRAALDSPGWSARVWGWMDSLGLGQLKTVLAPLIVIFTVTPLLVIVVLLGVALLATPAAVELVARRRFATLERKQGGSVFKGFLWSLLSTALALVALVVSLPLWLVPPLILVLPPLIWGWLTYRVMAYDVLADYASASERQQLLSRYRVSLLAMGVLTGYLGAAPGLLWASGALFAAAFVIFLPLAIWIYTLVFVFSSLWFAHFGLSALEKLRADTVATVVPEPAHQNLPEALALQDELRSAGLAPSPLPPSSAP